MEFADFTVVIDLSGYPDGTYSMGSANRFYADGLTFSFGYTFGDAYTFTLVDGMIVSMGNVYNVYDGMWIYDPVLVRAFQDALISAGWLDGEAIMFSDGEYGTLGDTTYQAIWDLQQYTATLTDAPEMQPVADENGSFKDMFDQYYPIDEATYDFIMNEPPVKPDI